MHLAARARVARDAARGEAGLGAESEGARDRSGDLGVVGVAQMPHRGGQVRRADEDSIHALDCGDLRYGLDRR